MLDRLEKLEVDMRNLKAVPGIAKMIADHEAEQAEAAKKAKEASDKEADDKRQAEVAAQGQAAKELAAREGRPVPTFEEDHHETQKDHGSKKSGTR